MKIFKVNHKGYYFKKANPLTKNDLEKGIKALKRAKNVKHHIASK